MLKNIQLYAKLKMDVFRDAQKAALKDDLFESERYYLGRTHSYEDIYLLCRSLKQVKSNAVVPQARRKTSPLRSNGRRTECPVGRMSARQASRPTRSQLASRGNE